MDIKQKFELARLYAAAFRRVVEGQGIELNWHSKNIFDITERDYLNMVAGKTAALLSLSCELGAFLGGANSRDCNNVKSAGEYLGLSFQIKDDILNLTGSFDKYKKEIGGDISEGKRTLMVVYALQNAKDSEKLFIKKILSSHSKNQQEISEVINILKNSGAVDYANRKAEDFKLKALESINKLRASKEKEALIELADYIIKREG